MLHPADWCRPINNKFKSYTDLANNLEPKSKWKSTSKEPTLIQNLHRARIPLLLRYCRCTRDKIFNHLINQVMVLQLQVSFKSECKATTFLISTPHDRARCDCWNLTITRLSLYLPKPLDAGQGLQNLLCRDITAAHWLKANAVGNYNYVRICGTDTSQKWTSFSLGSISAIENE